ncbi:hypothetical protein [Bradyrhizobium sp. S3.9.1]|uniref:hypothetical protein n=1 Tax=Bradyrhizobium sp. S3.9.1 TaxID=3156431 RepID=UPI00339807C9
MAELVDARDLKSRAATESANLSFKTSPSKPSEPASNPAGLQNIFGRKTARKFADETQQQRGQRQEIATLRLASQPDRIDAPTSYGKIPEIAS